MITKIEKAEKMSLYSVALNGVVAFPSVPLIMEIGEEIYQNSCKEAFEADKLIFAVCKKETGAELSAENLYKVGTVVKVKQCMNLHDGNMRVFAEPLYRAKAVKYYVSDDSFYADVIVKKTSDNENTDAVSSAALLNEANSLLESMKEISPKISADLIRALKEIKDMGIYADFASSQVLASPKDKQMILEIMDPQKRLESFMVLLRLEEELIRTETDIHTRVRAKLDENQREYYLREQIRQIEEELGDDDDECREYMSKLKKTRSLPPEIYEKIRKEIGRLEKNPYNSVEAAIIRNYIDICFELPWGKRTADKADIIEAKKILDNDHYGLEKVKERIIEFLAVKQLSPDVKSQVICLVGPPGTGKTSVVASIARALNRKYVRVSLGGIRDEAEIRGHRKTYVASMPGRIMNAIAEAGVCNPIILLDEIDKLANDAHGDPAAALLEVLDGEQNKSFRDHFLEFPFDLSECMFIATANTLETVSRPLIDRMEVIELKTYTRTEKLMIAREHLIQKQLKRHGLKSGAVKFKDDALYEIIDYYTREAGVRNLEREIGSICRKAAKYFIESGKKTVTVKASDIESYLGARKILPDVEETCDEIGVVNGLAYTEVGGDMLKVEAVTMRGTGKIELTGSLGDVMKESARAAISYIRANSDKYSIDGDFYKNLDIHIHVPEGAVPKDGPSAGVTITTAVVSALTHKSVKHDVAMTGEVTLRGRVLPIGGLREKTMAAYRNNVKTVFIPKQNEKDLTEIDSAAKDGLDFRLCENVDDVIMNSINW